MLRVRLDTDSPEVSANLIKTLSEMTALQAEHTGVITYMFARPDPATNPNHFEFTEVYANEGAFWAHSSHPDFMAAYVRMFPPGQDSHTKSTTYGYGPGMEGKVKSVCGIVLPNFQCPETSTGFVLSPKDWSTGTKAEDDGPVTLVLRIRSKEGSTSRVVQILNDLSKEAGEGVVVCHASIPESGTAPLEVELVMVCSANAHAASFVRSPGAEQLFKTLQNEATCVRGEAYGTLQSAVEGSFKDLGVVLDQRVVDAGYVLHPHADRNGS